LTRDVDEQVVEMRTVGTVDYVDEIAIRIVKTYATARFIRDRLMFRVSWTEEDIAQEMILGLMAQAETGHLPAMLGKTTLERRWIDAFRKLTTDLEYRRDGNTKHDRAVRAGDARRYSRSDLDVISPQKFDVEKSDRRETANRGVSVLELLEEQEIPQTPAEELRKMYEEAGGWTRAFHDSLDIILAKKIHVAALKLAKVRSTTERAVDAVFEWIKNHPGENPTSEWLGYELNLSRETVIRRFARLRKGEKITRELVEDRESQTEDNGRVRGQYRYFPAEEKQER